MISSSGCMQLPRPRPRTSIDRLTQTSDVSAPQQRQQHQADDDRAAEPTIGKSRMWPVREMTWPAPIEPAIMPATIGSISRPASVGEAPWTICM